jgi:flagellar biosynthesis/type III secretory pathway chaperone
MVMKIVLKRKKQIVSMNKVDSSFIHGIYKERQTVFSSLYNHERRKDTAHRNAKGEEEQLNGFVQ